MNIKVYNKSYVELTTLFGIEVTKARYKKVINKYGEASFVVRLDSAKVNNTILNHFNRVEFIENGEVVFTGYMIRFDINYDIAEVRCVGLLGILEKRVSSNSYAVNGTIPDMVTQIITAVNSVEDTGLTVGVVTATGSVNKVYNRSKYSNILDDLVDVSGKQMKLNGDRSLDVLNQIGTDLSETVILQYDVTKTAFANILNFKVSDDGDDIVTVSYGKSDSRNSTKENLTTKSKYGICEKYRDFRVANSQDDLDLFTNSELKSNLFSPEISLSPKVSDNFEVGDTVRVIIKNKIIDLDNSFQVLEKEVEYIGEQKRLKIRISDLPRDLADEIKEVNDRINLLEENV